MKKLRHCTQNPHLKWYFQVKTKYPGLFFAWFKEADLQRGNKEDQGSLDYWIIATSWTVFVLPPPDLLTPLNFQEMRIEVFYHFPSSLNPLIRITPRSANRLNCHYSTLEVVTYIWAKYSFKHENKTASNSLVVFPSISCILTCALLNNGEPPLFTLGSPVSHVIANADEFSGNNLKCFPLNSRLNISRRKNNVSTTHFIKPFRSFYKRGNTN